MITIAPLRTKRLSVQLREISISAAIRLAGIPLDLNEQATTALLQQVVEHAGTPTAAHVADPLRWTVQERMLVVCHYLSHVTEGGPDFAVGGQARFSTYLMAGRDYQAQPVDAGDIGGDQWVVRPLIGAHAQAIESLREHVDGMDGRFHWIVGAMAAQMTRPEDEWPDAVDQASEYQDALAARMAVLSAYPESDFAALLAAWRLASLSLAHFFQIDFDDAGVVATPAVDGGDGEMPSARFPVRACLSDISTQVFVRNAGAGASPHPGDSDLAGGRAQSATV